MKRRRLVALVSACVLLALGLLAVLTGVVVTRTSFGREEIRKLVQAQLDRATHGHVYIGRISGNLLTGVTLDSIAIRDVDDDSLFVSAGQTTVVYDPRDLIDKRIWIRRLDVEHPQVYLREHENGRWNFKEIFRSYEPQKKGPKTPGRSFGDFVVVDSAHITQGRFVLQMPWHPDDTLHGAKLDSAIRYTTTRPDKEIRPLMDDGKLVYTRTWRWTDGYAFASHMRIADPDSNRFGRFFRIDSLRVNESDPPFDFRDVTATLQNRGDSIWVDAPHFDLPASTGSGRGKIWWGGDLPIRLDIAVRGDSVSLKDVDWVYPTLPTTGGGTVNLRIRSEPDPRIIDYALHDMNVRSTGSHLRGDMTFGVGAPVLIVKDVKLDADPMDFDLLRTLNGKPFPIDWRGQVYGNVRGRGGALNHFVVDDAQAAWHDTHVRGAVSRFAGRGELDILEPAVTAFHGFDANVQSLDLRSIEYLFPSFPRLGGTVSGTAQLDSSWLDLRFSNADVFHQDGPGDPSHVTGSGRVTWGAKYMTYDVDLMAQPLSLTMLSRSYPGLPFRGLVSGPIQAKGTIANLQLDATLQGTMGTLAFNGLVDIDTPTVAARGTGQFTALDAAQLLAAARSPASNLNGRYEVDVAGDSLANLQGTAFVQLDRSELDSVRVFPSRARVHFADGRLKVDSMLLETSAVSLAASGGLGLPHGPADSLRFTMTVDSLGGLRRFISRPAGIVTVASGDGPATVAAGDPPADSLSGTFTVGGVAKGSFDSLDVAGWLSGANLYLRKERGHNLSGRFDLRNILANPAGTVALRLDTLRLGGVDLDSIGGVLRIANKSAASFSLGALSHTGPTLVAEGNVRLGGSDSLLLGLTSLSAVMDSSRWSLVTPAHVLSDSAGAWLDSLVVASNRGARLFASGAAPMTGPVRIDLRADSISLSDIGSVSQLPTAISGRGALEAHVTGTRASPEITMRSALRDFRMGGMHFEGATANGTYHDQRFDATMALLNGGVPAVSATASLPLDLTSFHVRLPEDSLRGSVRADSADLSLLDAFSPAVQDASGRLMAELDLGGTWSRPTLGGNVRLADGDMVLPKLGIRVRGIEGDVGLVPGRDSLVVRNFTAWSGRTPADNLTLGGFVSFANRSDPLIRLRLDAHSFHALDKKSLARLDVSTGGDGLRLEGRTSAATLSGILRVDRGVLYLPDRDLAQKQIVDLTSPDATAVVDTSDIRSRSLLPDAPPSLVENLRLDGVRIDLGDDVWLRSHEADIKLVGSLNVTRAPDDLRISRNPFSRGAQGPTYHLALDGTLYAERGTYTLDMLAVQREFQVQKGTITFTGTPDNNPLIDVSALYTVRRPRERDLGVIVRVHGPLFPYPVIDFSSTENYEISQNDLISYLLTGLPSFQLQEDVTKTAAQVLLPTASSVLARSLRTQLGSWVNMVQFGAADVSSSTFTGPSGGAMQAGKDFLFGARLGGDTQVGKNLFFSFSAGLCPLTEDQASFGTFTNAVGGKLEYRVNSDLSLQAGREPPSRSLYCGTGAYSAMRTLAPTPPQWGLSLLRTWHF